MWQNNVLYLHNVGMIILYLLYYYEIRINNKYMKSFLEKKTQKKKTSFEYKRIKKGLRFTVIEQNVEITEIINRETKIKKPPLRTRAT